MLIIEAQTFSSGNYLAWPAIYHSGQVDRRRTGGHFGLADDIYMISRWQLLFLTIGGALLALACNLSTQSLGSPTTTAATTLTATATAQPTAMTPTSATATPPPAAIATTAVPATPAPTVTPVSASPTAPVATALPVPTPTDNLPAISIGSPLDEATALAGVNLAVSGIAQPGPGTVITVVLLQENAGPVTRATALWEGQTWQATITTPTILVGPFLLVASVEDGNGNSLAQAAHVITLETDDQTPSAVSLELPTRYQQAVAGSTLYFRGSARQASPNFSITIAVRYNDCRQDGATTTFTMSGSGQWEGFLTVPQNLVGPVCALAIVGEGSPTQRTAQVPLSVMDRTDAAARAIQVVDPQADANLSGNGVLTVRGLVYAAPNEAVTVSVRLPDGSLGAETTTLANYFGYWEADLVLSGLSGSAEIVAQLGSAEDNSLIEANTPITLTP